MKRKLLFSVAWGKRFFQTLHREAALDSAKNVLAVVGVGTLLGDFAEMRAFFILGGLALLFLIWFIDYQRHFTGESIEDSCARELTALRTVQQ
jgi:hypothetical protein